MDPRVFAFAGFASPMADEMRRRVAQLGGRSLRNLTKDVRYFVVRSKSHPDHPRMVRARQLGINIMTEDEFWRQFGANSSSKRTSARDSPRKSATRTSKKSPGAISILFYPTSNSRPPVRHKPTTRDAWISARRRVAVALQDFLREKKWNGDMIKQFEKAIDEIDLLLHGRKTHVYIAGALGRNERNVPDESIIDHLASAIAKLMYGRTLWRKTRRARTIIGKLMRELRT
jgi:hypothetical protein